ncbi:MAG: VWA domain-containing protein [Defluviitaleaceae bacterium]|nr:VWA domain-containing protein [Defluviitaleaceae bacterium]
MKKAFFLALLIFATLAPTIAYAEELIPIDAVLVLDVSRSMRTADPQRTSRDAMNLFIEKLEENRDRVGVIAYAGNVEAYIELSEINREQKKNFINGLPYASWTDHGVGLTKAVEMLLSQADQARQGIIIFLTDGNMNVNPASTRTNETAQQEVYAAKQAAYENNIPIHTIGLNFDGNLALEYINRIAQATNGLSFETANAADIPQIIEAFFHEMIAAPQAIAEENPIPHIYVQKPQIQILPTDKNAHFERSTNIPAIGTAVILAILTVILIKTLTTPKRVFTGKIILDKTTKNLIEYGNRVTLAKLLGVNTATPFSSVILAPSPTAPSHLPQLLIKCKNPRVKFTKGFIEQDLLKGVSISLGTEAVIETDVEQIRFKYSV